MSGFGDAGSESVLERNDQKHVEEAGDGEHLHEATSRKKRQMEKVGEQWRHPKDDHREAELGVVVVRSQKETDVIVLLQDAL